MIRVSIKDGHWEIWSEPEKGDVAVGRCIGAGPTLEAARTEAYLELNRDHAEVEALKPDMPVCYECGTPLLFDEKSQAEKPCGHSGILVFPADIWLTHANAKETRL
jgi:hypothetical protein